MDSQKSFVIVQPDSRQLDYRHMPLVELIERTVHEQDREALQELHDHRPVFHCPNMPPFHLAELVYHLYRHTPKKFSRVAEEAYTLTIDKFSHIPDNPNEESSSSPKPKIPGPDCRFYFRAFLQHFYATKSHETIFSQVQEEFRAAHLLQGLVIRHFYFSLLECLRKVEPGLTRYLWKVNGGGLPLWLPAELRRDTRRAWLEANIADPDPYRPSEPARIQSIINERFGVWTRIIPEEETAQDGFVSIPQDPAPGSVLPQLAVDDIANAVAGEKVQMIHTLRPAIRALGSHRLEQLILRIFADLSDSQYQEKEIAGEFGLHPSTVSRFAGIRWGDNSKEGKNMVIPDLWLNTAHTLAANPRFTEAAHEAQIWDRLQAVLQSFHDRK